MKYINQIFLFLFIISLTYDQIYNDAKTINEIISHNFNKMVERESRLKKLNNDNNNNNVNYIKEYIKVDQTDNDHIDEEEEEEEEDHLLNFNGHQHKHLPGYKCIHDMIAENFGIKNPTDQELKEIHNRKLLELEEQQANSNLLAATVPRKPLRFYFDTTYLYNNKDIASCNKVGQIVALGGTNNVNANTPKCRSDGTYYSCFYTCTEQDILNKAVADLLSNDIVPTIQELLGNMVLVDRLTSPLIINRNDIVTNSLSCDYDYTINNTYLSTGIPNTDMVVFVTARPIQSTSTIAYSAPCVYRNGDRPQAATINFNPRYFLPFVSSNKPSDFIFNEYIRVGIHEMTHGLGFTQNFFAYFNDRYNGNRKYTGSNIVGSNKTTSGTTPNGVTWIYDRAGVSTTEVKYFVMNHYNCYSNISNYQLFEDYGSAGTVGSHWEKRTVGEEYMLGFVSPVFPITKLTLALLMDSGWYDVNDTLAEPLMWGKGLGCDWFDDCNSKSWNYPGYFCDNPSAQRCSPTRVGKGRCNTQTGWSNLPYAYQHFQDTTKAGDLIADGCPFYDVTSSYCVDASNSKSANTAISENYGEDSRCFEYTDTSNSHLSLACWSTRCSGQNLEVLVNQVWVTCDVDGKSVQFGNIAFTCPKYFYPCRDSNFTAPNNAQYPSFPGIEDINHGSSLAMINNIYLLSLFLIVSIIYLF